MYSISPSPGNQTLTLVCRWRSRDFFADHDSGHKFTLVPLRPVTFIFLFCARESSINSMNITCNFVAPAKEHRWHHIWPSSVGSYGLAFVFASLRSPSDSLCWTSFTRTPLRLKSRFSSTHSSRYRMCHRLFVLSLYMSLKPILQLLDKVTAALRTRIYFQDLKSHALNTRPIKLNGLKKYNEDVLFQHL